MRLSLVHLYVHLLRIIGLLEVIGIECLGVVEVAGTFDAGKHGPLFHFTIFKMMVNMQITLLFFGLQEGINNILLAVEYAVRTIFYDAFSFLF